MIQEKHEKWVRKKFPIFYTIKVNLDREFTPIELDSLENDLLANRPQVLSKQSQKTLKKLKKLANDSQKVYRSNKELYNLLSTVDPQEIHQITLAHKKIQCLKPLQKIQLLKLSQIDLAFNSLQEIFPLTTSALPSLTYFTLAQNDLKNLKGLETCVWPKLRILNLSNSSLIIKGHNQITNIEPLFNGQFISLQKLDISQNLITILSGFHKSSCWELRLLSFKNNRLNSLKNIQRLCFTKMSELNLNDNPLTNIADIQKLQTTTLRNKRASQGGKRILTQKGNEFINYSYKLFYNQMIHKFKKEDLLLDFFEQKLTKNPLKCSKHAQYAIVEAYHQPEIKVAIIPTKKLHFD